MVSARKRSLHDVDGSSADALKEPSMRERVRNMWQFANVCQWIAIFGAAVKAANVEVDDLEVECLNPHSMALQEIGLSLLKFLSSHRGLSHELFDEYTRRQYISKVPLIPNPFGNDEEPRKFADFDVFTKIRVLHQMILFIMMYPEKLRDKMTELKDIDHDQTSWRIEPIGWDRRDRTYYVLDDNRVYRMTEPPPPQAAPAKPKKNSIKARAAARASKRRRISSAQDSCAEDGGDEATEHEAENTTKPPPVEEDDGLGGMKWECVAVTLQEVNELLSTMEKTKDPNEKVLRDSLREHLVPILAGEEQKRERREKERERELLNLAKMANAKRSSRIANKAEHQKQEDQAREDERKRYTEEVAERKAEQQRLKIERERDNRLMSREKRLKEREARRMRHEDELAQLSEDSRHVDGGSGRMSERHLHAQIEKNKQALKELEEEEDEWVFDCVCGLHGQVDDGEHSVSCERCNVWQHSKCLGIAEQEAEHDDFHFICDSCRRAQEEKLRPPPRLPVIKIKVKGSTPTKPTDSTTHATVSEQKPARQKSMSADMVIDIPAKGSNRSSPPKEVRTAAGNGRPSSGSSGTNGLYQPDSVLLPPRQDFSKSIPVKTDGISTNGSFSDGRRASLGSISGSHNPFSSPHPALSPPDQSPTKSRAYNTLYDPSTSPILNSGRDRPQVVNGDGARISSTPIMRPAPFSESGVSASNSKKQQQGTPSAPMVTPRIASAESRSGEGYDQKSSPLPPSRGGLSPTKHSPSLAQALPAHIQSPAPPILPPVAALPPSPQEQNLTPPVKLPGLPQQSLRPTVTPEAPSNLASG